MNKLQTFVIWLDGYLDAVGEDQFNISKTNVIRNKLNVLFEHVAEPIEEPKLTLEELGDQHGFPVHNGFPNGEWPKNDSDNETYRC